MPCLQIEHFVFEQKTVEYGKLEEELLSTLADPCLHKSYLKDICKVQEKQFGECLNYAKWSRVCNDASELMCGVVSGLLRQLCLHNYVVKILLAFLEQNVATIIYLYKLI